MLHRNAALRFLIAGALALVAATPASAQTGHRIVAVVNDDMISAYDLEARLRLAIALDGLQDTAEIRRRIRPAVLRSLIDERLILQEARRRGVSVSARELDRRFAAFSRRRNIPENDLERILNESDLSKDSLAAQYRAEIAWDILVHRRFGPLVSFSEEEVQERLDDLKERQGQAQYRLSEIVLAVDGPDNEELVLDTASRLIEQIRRGARFDDLARRFSESATAAVYGDLGWVDEADLGEELRGRIADMRPGDVSVPMRTATGYRIVALNASRRIAQRDAGGDVVSLRRISLPLPAEAGAEEVAQTANKAREIAGDAKDCEDFEGRVDGAGLSAPLERIPERALAPRFRRLVGSLEPGVPSAPIAAGQGVMVVMVCAREKTEPKFELPDRDVIADRLMRRRISLMGRRYLRDLRSSATIDERS